MIDPVNFAPTQSTSLRRAIDARRNMPDSLPNFENCQGDIIPLFVVAASPRAPKSVDANPSEMYLTKHPSQAVGWRAGC